VVEVDGLGGDVVGRRGRGVGAASPALLRPSTGQVWVFAGWSADGVPEAGRAAATVAGASQLVAKRREGCDRLVVSTPDGQSTTVG
jgi:hypothetical protein